MSAPLLLALVVGAALTLAGWCVLRWLAAATASDVDRDFGGGEGGYP